MTQATDTKTYVEPSDTMIGKSTCIANAIIDGRPVPHWAQPGTKANAEWMEGYAKTRAAHENRFNDPKRHALQADPNAKTHKKLADNKPTCEDCSPKRKGGEPFVEPSDVNDAEARIRRIKKSTKWLVAKRKVDKKQRKQVSRYLHGKNESQDLATSIDGYNLSIREHTARVALLTRRITELESKED